MYSIGIGLKLKPDAYEGYKKAHDECWPELLELQRAHGVNMIIYRWDDQLFIHATAPSEAEWLNTREGPLVDKWNDFMTQYLETDKQGNILFEDLNLAFQSGDFATSQVASRHFKGRRPL